MSNIAGALYRVTKIKNEMKCSRRMRSVSRQCQFKQPCLTAGTNSRSQLEVVGEVGLRRCRAVQTPVDQHT